MDTRFSIPFIIAAEAGVVSDSWGLTIANYGVATGMLAWFIWKDKLERDDRKQEKIDQERRHQENLAAQHKVEAAFRTHTDLLIVGLAAMKTIDIGYQTLLEKIKNSNAPDKK